MAGVAIRRAVAATSALTALSVRTLAGAATAGMAMSNVLPPPGVLSTVIRPPISSASVDEIARPRPVPPNRRVIEPST